MTEVDRRRIARNARSRFFVDHPEIRPLRRRGPSRDFRFKDGRFGIVVWASWASKNNWFGVPYANNDVVIVLFERVPGIIERYFGEGSRFIGGIASDQMHFHLTVEGGRCYADGGRNPIQLQPCPASLI